MDRPGTWKLTSVGGVIVRIHFSLALVLIYLAFLIVARFDIATSRAGVDASQLLGTPFAWGLLLAAALFVSVFIHEFGHVWVAKRQGIPVRGITLMMIGGVSEIERMPEQPYAEFKLAVIGPVVSFALAAALLSVRSLTDVPEISFFCHWLGQANLVLAIFNLLPAFPLDGGRALRSILASRWGRVRATQASARIGKVLAWALGIFGLLTFNLLLALVAVFIYASAQREQFVVLSKSLLHGLKVSDVMTRVPSIAGDASLRDAASRMLETRNTSLPVEDARERRELSAGTITLAQVRRVPRERWDTTRIKDVMTGASKSFSPRDPISELLPELSGSMAEALPIVDHGEVIGLVRASDLNELLEFRRFEDAA